jgi:hypothetical protein
MPQHRAADVMLAVHELAANAVRPAPPRGGGAAADAGRERGVARAGPRCRPASLDGHTATGDADGQETGGADRWPCQPGHGLWLARQVTDQVSVLCGQAGSLVTAVFTLPAAGVSPAAPGGPGP